MKLETGIYKHFKGGTVLVIGLSASSDDKQRVLYIGMQDKTFHDRPLDEFLDMTIRDNKEIQRFTLVEPIEITSDTILNNYVGHTKTK